MSNAAEVTAYVTAYVGGGEEKHRKGKVRKCRSPVFSEPPGDLAEDVPGGKRLGEAAVHTGLAAERKNSVRIVARETEDEGPCRIPRSQLPEGPGGVQSVQNGHFQIEENHVGRMFFRQVQGFPAVRRNDDLPARAGEHF